MILLITGSSTEPDLFHASCRPSLHVGLRPALTSDLLVRKARPALTSDLLVRKAHPSRQEHILSQWWKTPIQTGTHPITVMKDLSTYIWPTRQKGTSIQTGTHPIIVMEDSHPDRNTSYHSDERFQHLSKDHFVSLSLWKVCFAV